MVRADPHTFQPHMLDLIMDLAQGTDSEADSVPEGVGDAVLAGGFAGIPETTLTVIR